MSQTIVEKIAQAHLAEGPNRPLRTGDFVSIRLAHLVAVAAGGHHTGRSVCVHSGAAVPARAIAGWKTPEASAGLRRVSAGLN